MKLIADSGSTKTDWVLCHETILGTYSTIGYNPFFLDADGISLSIKQSLIPQISEVNISEVYFYGAGCSSPDKRGVVENALSRVFPSARIEVNHDLLASARALLGRNSGFAAILGTGANTCLYDGELVTLNVDSLGYLLGDEGSGSYIGRKVVRDFMRKTLPEALMKAFSEMYGLTNADLYEHLYFKPLPNRYLASFSRFAGEYSSHPHIHALLEESFDDFFKHLVTKYPNYTHYSFNCVGSVGFTFQSYLRRTAEKYEMSVGNIIKSPMDNLVNFHLT